MWQKPTFRLFMSEAKEDGRKSVLGSPDLDALLDMNDLLGKGVQLHVGCHSYAVLHYDRRIVREMPGTYQISP